MRAARSKLVGAGRRRYGGIRPRARATGAGRQRRKKYGPQPVRTEARESGSGCAMERAVREGDTGLHHTAKDPSVSAGSEPVARFRLARWSVRSAVFYRTIIERFAASDGRGHHRRLVSGPDQASRGSSRDAGADHAVAFQDFNTRSTRNSTRTAPRNCAAPPQATRLCELLDARPFPKTACRRREVATEFPQRGQKSWRDNSTAAATQPANVLRHQSTAAASQPTAT